MIRLTSSKRFILSSAFRILRAVFLIFCSSSNLRSFISSRVCEVSVFIVEDIYCTLTVKSIIKASGLILTSGYNSWYKRVNDTQERLLKLHGVLLLCPNKPSVFIIKLQVGAYLNFDSSLVTLLLFSIQLFKTIFSIWFIKHITLNRWQKEIQLLRKQFNLLCMQIKL